MNRRTFVRTTVAAAASSFLMGAAHAQPAPKLKNVVLVHGQKSRAPKTQQLRRLSGTFL